MGVMQFKNLMKGMSVTTYIFSRYLIINIIGIGWFPNLERIHFGQLGKMLQQ